MGQAGRRSFLEFVRVIGGWILAFGSFLVAVAVTLEFIECPGPPQRGFSGSYTIEVKPTSESGAGPRVGRG